MNMFERFLGKKLEEVQFESTKEGSQETVETEKTRKAEEILYLLIDAIDEFLPENQNALIAADKNRVNGIWDRYIKELVQGNSPVFYVDNGGITRMQFYNNELTIVHSGEMPSKIKGKTIQDFWDEIKDKYNPKMSNLMSELNIR
jgi:hypothetical protein